jgi:hypothetical protein
MKFWAWLKRLFDEIDTRPDWARKPCPECHESKMKWLPGQDSSSTACARFKCTNCDYWEYRGAWGSECSMEKWKARR